MGTSLLQAAHTHVRQITSFPSTTCVPGPAQTHSTHDLTVPFRTFFNTVALQRGSWTTSAVPVKFNGSILKGIWSLHDMGTTHKFVGEAERRPEHLCTRMDCLWALHLPPRGIDSNGSWLTEVSVEKCPPPASICGGHWDGLVSGICPVDVFMNPVYCQTFRRVQLAVYQNHLLGCVTRFVNVGTAKTGLSLDWQAAQSGPCTRAWGWTSDSWVLSSTAATFQKESAHVAAWLTQKPLRLHAAACCFLLQPVCSSLYLHDRCFWNRELSFYFLPASSSNCPVWQNIWCQAC